MNDRMKWQQSGPNASTRGGAPAREQANGTGPMAGRERAEDDDDDDGDEEKSAGKALAKGAFEHLFKSRQILLTGPVTGKSSRAVLTALYALEAADPKKPITMILNSPGGSVTDGFAIYDAMNFVRPEVRVLTTGLCASIATIILAAAPKKWRVCTPNTRLLIHQPHMPMGVYGPASDLEITANEILKTRARLNEVLAEACGQSLEVIERDTQRDYWMTAEEAKDYGLITEVVQSRAAFEEL